MPTGSTTWAKFNKLTNKITYFPQVKTIHLSHFIDFSTEFSKRYGTANEHTVVEGVGKTLDAGISEKIQWTWNKRAYIPFSKKQTQAWTLGEVMERSTKACFKQVGDSERSITTAYSEFHKAITHATL